MTLTEYQWQEYEKRRDERTRLGYVIASTVLTLVIGAGVACAQHKAPDRDYSTVEVCDAIFRAEGGAKAQYYYGIRSVRYKDLAEAQRICFNTVRHARKDWTAAGKPGGFIEFLGRRYCPVGAENDPKGLNRNWVKNVRYFINHKNTK